MRIAGVAQRQCKRFVSERLRVQLLPPAPISKARTKQARRAHARIAQLAEPPACTWRDARSTRCCGLQFAPLDHEAGHRFHEDGRVHPFVHPRSPTCRGPALNAAQCRFDACRGYARVAQPAGGGGFKPAQCQFKSDRAHQCNSLPSPSGPRHRFYTPTSARSNRAGSTRP
jgi:hypothetical protein